MLTSIGGAICRVNALYNKYVDIEFREIDVTDQVIEEMFSMFGNQPYYAIRIHSKNVSFLEYLSRTFGFINGIMWSKKRQPPMEVIFRDLVDGGALNQTNNAFGDIVYHPSIYVGNEYTVPVGVQGGVNVLMHLQNAPFRVLNPVWDGTMDYTDNVPVQLPESVEAYLLENGLVLSSENCAHTLGVNYEFMYNPLNGGMTFKGDAKLELKPSALVLYNEAVNIPLSHSIAKFGKFGIDAAIFKTTDAIIFEFKRVNYLCVPHMNICCAVSNIEVPDWFTVSTPIGKDINGQPIKTLHWVHRKDEQVATG